ncbi:putative F-box/LRR-repeat protein 23 [Brachypodium distachyon]|uniref:Uncharacterized protein n=1 Tax=Brachypodium distachyon TaxID=15368 RepID=A0A0Q3F6X7_BRADI|nr:putative F-box/LRR-repeat protein 23 [Brachypodium distachyon]KQJ95487.2 hypothetical protein BRADI_3g17440v3 [Brachypodium distachyon]|eukprot:XP_024317934.1 putative F-box/LRR-repeat protein 23 [Brachypodium distachyon]
MELEPEDTLPVPAPPCARDWSELPFDALALILGKLGAVEILMGAGLVCHSWLDAAKLPHLWREVDIGRGPRDQSLILEKSSSAWSAMFVGMAKMAVDRSDGKMEVFVGDGFVNDALLSYIAQRATSLKTLCIIRTWFVSNEGFAEAIKKLPMLMELEVSVCLRINGNRVFDVVGIACPHLTRFRYSKSRFYINDGVNDSEDEKARAIATMRELRSLQLYAVHITNEGLTAILDNCHQLESLDIRHCFEVDMNDALREKCARIKTLRLPEDSTDDYEFEVLPPFVVG